MNANGKKTFVEGHPRILCLSLSILLFGIFEASCQHASLETEMDALAKQHRLTGAPLLDKPFQQAWKEGQEEDFEAGRVRLYEKDNSFHVLAVLRDGAIGNEAVAFNERTWETGDVFEIFIEPDPAHYYELHVTPENSNLFLRFTPESIEAVRRDPTELENALIADPAFIPTATRIDRNRSLWTVYAQIPLAQLERNASISGSRFRVAFARYDATAEREEPILSATPPFRRLDFHDRSAWHSLEWPAEVEE